MFGSKLKVGLKSSLPAEALISTNPEEEQELGLLLISNDNDESQSYPEYDGIDVIPANSLLQHISKIAPLK